MISVTSSTITVGNRLSRVQQAKRGGWRISSLLHLYTTNDSNTWYNSDSSIVTTSYCNSLLKLRQAKQASKSVLRQKAARRARHSMICKPATRLSQTSKISAQSNDIEKNFETNFASLGYSMLKNITPLVKTLSPYKPFVKLRLWKVWYFTRNVDSTLEQGPHTAKVYRVWTNCKSTVSITRTTLHYFVWPYCLTLPECYSRDFRNWYEEANIFRYNFES